MQSPVIAVNNSPISKVRLGKHPGLASTARGKRVETHSMRIQSACNPAHSHDDPLASSGRALRLDIADLGLRALRLVQSMMRAVTWDSRSSGRCPDTALHGAARRSSVCGKGFDGAKTAKPGGQEASG